MSRILIALSILAVTLGCHDGQSATAPTETPRGFMYASSPTEFAVFPGEEVSRPPVVRVLWRDDAPVPGVRVTFAYADGTSISVATDNDGYARTSKWRLDYTKSADSVIATADGVSRAIKFKALTIQKEIVAFYDLISIEGKSLPYGTDAASGIVTGGHYVLFSDGTYTSTWDVNGKGAWQRPLQFIRRASSIEFYRDAVTAPQQFYANSGYLFAIGTLSNSGMSVEYNDGFDFSYETYVKR